MRADGTNIKGFQLITVVKTERRVDS